VSAAAPGARPWSGRAAAFEGSVIVGFKAGEGSIEHFPACHDDDVVSADDLVAPEYFTRQSLGPISFNGVTKLAGCGHAEPRRGTAGGEHEQRQEPAVDASSFVIDALEVGSAPDPLVGCQAELAHSSATVSRFRPFERRRLSTMRPFFVDMRTRKPCVFFRRRVFG
jgi:hypothetical protein